MSHRFALIPAGVAESAGAADELLAEIRARPDGRPSDGIAAVVCTLEASGAGDFTIGRRADSRGVLLTAPHPEHGLLEALLLLTKDRFLAVYDITLRRLYDPTGSVDVDVALPGVRLPYLTRELLCDLVVHPEWPDPEAPYLIVDRSAQEYIQAWCCGDGGYQVEYREGGPESHFVVRNMDTSSVVEVMWAWANSDPAWRTDVDWVYLDTTLPDEKASGATRLAM